MIWPCKKNGSNKDTKKGITVLRKRDLLGDPEQDGLVRYWKASRRNEAASKKSNRKDCEKKENMGHFLLINPCKREK